MIAIRILCLLFCGCFAVVSSQSTDEEMSSQCTWDDEEYVLQTFERKCGPTEQLLMEMKRSYDNVYAQMMTSNCPVQQKELRQD